MNDHSHPGTPTPSSSDPSSPQLTAVDATGRPLMVTNEESALLNVTARERPGLARGQRASAAPHATLLARTAEHAALASLPLRWAGAPPI